MLILKAMIYVTSPQGVLVFEEPESPHIGLQVPGGTIEQGEDPLLTAGRELYEETGLTAGDTLRFLGSIDCVLPETDQSYTQPDTMRRYYYHVHFEETFPQSWEHYEMHACDGMALSCSGCSGCHMRRHGLVWIIGWPNCCIMYRTYSDKAKPACGTQAGLRD